MKIEKSQDYLDSLKDVLVHIAKDSKQASGDFLKNTNIKIRDLTYFPYKYRKSIYFNDVDTRDLIYKGYTIPYEVDVENNTIVIIGITKYRQNLKRLND